MNLFVSYTLLTHCSQWMDKKGKQHTYKCEALIKLGIFYAFIRRKSLAENERMEGDRIDSKNNRRWFCKVVVRVNDKPRTKMERLSTLAHCIDVSYWSGNGLCTS